MSCARMLLLSVTCLLCSAAVGHAAVYDIENMTTRSAGYETSAKSFAQLAGRGNRFGELVLDADIGPPSGCSSDDLLLGVMKPGASIAIGDRRIQTGSGHRLSSSIMYINSHGLRGSHPEERMPASPAREPRLYAVLLAGAGLVFLSVRRRKNDTFD